MNKSILFISATLEPVKCGVSDYVSTLAKELAKKNIRCACIALNDSFVLPTDLVSNFSWNQAEIPKYRISSKISWSDRSRILSSIVDSLKPDFISLQFVNFSFDPKGLPFSMIRCIAPLRSVAHMEIMFHELWVESSGGIRKYILSKLQRWVILSLIRVLQPKNIHVSNKYYQNRLLRHGFKAQIVPVFSNIPLKKLNMIKSNNPNIWTFVVFGSLSPEWNPEPLLSRVEESRILYKISSCTFLLLGKAGSYGEQLWDQLSFNSETIYPSFTFKRLGLLTTERLSEEFLRADFGISRAPLALVDKSGANAAMKAHGLPIIVNRLPTDFDEFESCYPSSDYLIPLDKKFIFRLGKSNKLPPFDSLAQTANQFLADLLNSL